MSIIYKLWVWGHIAKKNSFGNVLCCKSGLLQNCKERSCADDRVGGIRWQSSDFHDIRYSINSQFAFRYIKMTSFAEIKQPYIKTWVITDSLQNFIYRSVWNQLTEIFTKQNSSNKTRHINILISFWLHVSWKFQ